MSPGQPGKFAQACFVGRASGDKERWKHGAAQGGEAAVQRVVHGSGTVWQVRILPDATGAAWVLANFGDVRYSTAIRLEPNLLRQEYGVLEVGCFALSQEAHQDTAIGGPLQIRVSA
ncbi:hypothetical protein NDU88_004708 [Pleurodeles waltl]|uniref:Uncharacterized protein n=1 Tax=Pleurodeles waltl TaxID=8319 RepID=A0AAV7L0N0_PLEWA|nr:hypothetical protein NDU88_004708 [Pleurodeles waltl]